MEDVGKEEVMISKSWIMTLVADLELTELS